MTDLSFKEMQEMQRELQETYKEKWGGLYPEKFHTMMLYLFAEAGEAVDVVKKNGTEKVLNDEIVRTHFQSQHLIKDFALGGEDNNGNLVFGAYFTADLITVDTGKHEV